MKTCNGCKYAEWRRNKAGKLHPSGEGQCKYEWEAPELPAAFYFSFFVTPKPNGGFINRHEENNKNCPYYQRKD